MPNFREFVAQHPEILRPRDELCFERASTPSAVAEEWRRSGVVMLRGVLPPKVLEECRRTFHQFITTTVKTGREGRLPGNNGAMEQDDGPTAEWDNGEIEYGSWHAPWIIRHDGRAPMSIVLSELIMSWAWPVIEEICRSRDIFVMFGLCLGRHNIDRDLNVGVHQDATAVNPDVPLSIWIPLQDVAPRRQSGLGFVVPSPDHVVPAKPNNDIGGHYVVDNPNNLWVPHYQAGDLTIHSRYSPHFTTGYGTQTDRYSLEVRLWARDEAIFKYGDPSIVISRRNGVPVVVEARCSPGVGAHGFVASTAVLAMQRITRPEAAGTSAQHEKKENDKNKFTGVLAAIRDAVRRKPASSP